MAEDWQEPEETPSVKVIYGPRGERLRVWKEVGKRQLGFSATDNPNELNQQKD